MDSSLQIEQEIVVKFDVKNKPLYVKILWKDDIEDLFHITVFYEEKTWTGKYTKESAAKRRERLMETEEEYNKNVKNCLSVNSKDYTYDFFQSVDDANFAFFTWKKQYDGAVKLQGVVTLQEDEVPTSKNTLIDILLEKYNSLKLDIEHAKEKNSGLEEDLQKYIENLEKLTESKIMLETTLYGRFIQVLNEKKRRIQLLEDNIKALKTSE